jgi:hypothetical protein
LEGAGKNTGKPNESFKRDWHSFGFVSEMHSIAFARLKADTPRNGHAMRKQECGGM